MAGVTSQETQLKFCVTDFCGRYMRVSLTHLIAIRQNSQSYCSGKSHHSRVCTWEWVAAKKQVNWLTRPTFGLSGLALFILDILNFHLLSSNRSNLILLVLVWKDALQNLTTPIIRADSRILSWALYRNEIAEK